MLTSIFRFVSFRLLSSISSASVASTSSTIILPFVFPLSYRPKHISPCSIYTLPPLTHIGSSTPVSNRKPLLFISRASPAFLYTAIIMRFTPTTAGLVLAYASFALAAPHVHARQESTAVVSAPAPGATGSGSATQVPTSLSVTQQLVLADL